MPVSNQQLLRIPPRRTHTGSLSYDDTRIQFNKEKMSKWACFSTHDSCASAKGSIVGADMSRRLNLELTSGYGIFTKA